MGTSRVRTRGGATFNLKTGRRWRALNNTVYGAVADVATTACTAREVCWDETHPGPPYREGGPLRLLKADGMSTNIQGANLYYTEAPYHGAMTYQYEGGWIPVMSTMGLSTSTIQTIGEGGGTYGVNFGDPSPYGAAAWNRFKPKLEFGQIGVAIAELRDLPRMLQTTAKGFHYIWKTLGGVSRKRISSHSKSLSNHFLNTQFGWRPFIKDLRDIIETSVLFNFRYAQIKRDNGNWIRRSGTYSINSSVELSTGGSLSASSGKIFPLSTGVIYPQLFRNPYGKYYSHVSSEERVWFEGKFRYWLPTIDTDNSRILKIREMLRIYGVDLSPSLVWELIPWSWLIDWYTNTGDVISNMSNDWRYHLGAKYAYVMRQINKKFTLSAVCYLQSGNTPHMEWNGYVRSKRREGANPWGFEYEWGELSPTQIAILTALGLLAI